jgi:RNA polymerase sigma-70 factor (ECF subfamily)
MAQADDSSEVEVLLQQARAGDLPALGRLLESYRDDLAAIARSLLDPALRCRVASSDLVQETLLEAHRDFAQFAGGDERGLVAWLHKILVRNFADQANFHHAERRDVRRERSLDAHPEGSAPALLDALAAPISSASTQAMRREEAAALTKALERLPADYREVFVLRNLHGVVVEEIAARMGRTPNAVRMLWGRAVLKLSETLERPP